MKVFDVWNGNDNSFIMRAPFSTIEHRWRVFWVNVKGRFAQADGQPIILHGNGRHDDIIVREVRGDWFPE